MRILWVSVSPFAMTGYGRITREVVSRLLDKYEVICCGHEADVIVWGGKKTLHYKDRKIQTLVMINPLVNSAGAADTVKLYVNKYDIDLIIAHWDAFALEFLKYVEMPYLVYIPIDGPMTRKWANYVKDAYRIILYSKFGFNECLKFFPFSKLAYIPHGIDTKTFRPLSADKEELRKEIDATPPIPEDCFLFVTVAANVGSRKHLPLLLMTFKKLAKKYKRVHIYIHTNVGAPLGKGYDLLTWVDMLGIKDRVHFPRYNPILEGVDDHKLCEIYNAADVYVSNSCVPPETLIVCWDRIKPICEVKEGDYVLTHRGRFKRVTKVLKRYYSGSIIKIKLGLLNRSLRVTPEHPILSVGKVKSGCRIKTKDLHYYDEAVYREVLKLRRKKGWGSTKIAKKLGLPERTVAGWLYCGFKPAKRSGAETGIKWRPAYTLDENYFLCVPRVKDENILIQVGEYLDDVIEKGGSLYSIGRNQYGAEFIHPNVRPIPALINPSNEFLELAGYYIAEGCSNEDGIAICFSSLEEERIQRALELIEKFGMKPHLTYSSRHRSTQWGRGRLWGKLLGTLFGKKSCEKRIPPFLLQSSCEKLKVLWKSMFVGDGTLSSGISRYTTVSEELAIGTFLLLVKLGEIPSLVDETSSGHGYTVSITKGEKKRHGIMTDEYLLLPIRSVEIEHYEGFVYNLEVEEDNSYVAEGVVVHNCAEGFGLPILEAQACGTPCIVPNNSSQVELVKGHGWLVENMPEDMYVEIPVYVPYLTYYPVSDQRILYKAMENSYLADDLRAKYGRMAREFALKYDWKNIMPMWFSLLKEVEEELNMFRTIIKVRGVDNGEEKTPLRENPA